MRGLIGNRHTQGQHLLRDPDILGRIVEAAQISNNDVVFEIGTGEGDLTESLCEYAGSVVSIEINRNLFETAYRRLKKYRNLELIHGDGFNTERSFNILVSIIPYCRSRQFIEWLACRSFSRAVVTFQREFANKVLAKPGERNYKSMSVFTQAHFFIKRLFYVDRQAFDPPPKVSSAVLLLEPRGVIMSAKTILSLKKIFSFRGRLVASTLKTIFKNENEEFKRLIDMYDDKLLQKRVKSLTVNEAIMIAKMLTEFVDEN